MHATTRLWRRRLLVTLSLFYGLAGILHLLFPKPFLTIMPDLIPYPQAVIAVTGVIEIACALALWMPRFARLAGIGLALYAICVFPANIKHAMDALGGPDPSLWQWLYHCLRLPFQPVLVWAALFAGGIVDWPFRRTGEACSSGPNRT